MSDLLAVFSTADEDRELLEEIAAYHPDRVTVLIEDHGPNVVGENSPAGHDVRDKLAGLMAAIEAQTGATVVGLAGARSQLTGWRFDRELVARTPVPA
ncbi:MAG TPA: hypothetical protein VF781_11215 [Solirubrobacteraceae bacterium]